jgi:nucleoid-associated protein YgaU
MDAPNRLVASMVGLVVLWVAVYWLWPASPPVRFADVRSASNASIVSVTTGPNQSPTQSPTPPSAPATPPRKASESSLSSGSEPVQPVLVARRSDQPDSADAPSGSPTGVGVIAPAFREYRVRAGDTPASIAKRELGDAKLASAVLQANQLMSPAHLREGRIIRLPLDPSNVQGKPVTSNTVPSTPALPTPEYVVRKGDSLAAIARRVYGSEAHVQFLIDANKATLTDPSAIKPGQVLLVPQRTTN